MQPLSLVLFVSCLGLICSASLSSTIHEAEEWVRAMFQKQLPVVTVVTATTLPKLMQSMGETTMVDWVTRAGMMKTLSSNGPFTMMGPTDEAFKMLPPALKKMAETNHTILEGIVKYHVITGSVPTTTWQNDKLIPTMMGGHYMIRMNKYGDTWTASGRVVTKTDLKATNGLLNMVKNVLLPPPGNAAMCFTKCPTYTILTTALKVCGMLERWAAPGPFTIFAPTDKAFHAIPKETLENLMKNKTALMEILNFHIVKGTYYTAGMTNGQTLMTDCGKPLTIKIEHHAGKITVNDVPIYHPDVTVTNGVVHVVETVMMPPTAKLRVVVYAD